MSVDQDSSHRSIKSIDSHLPVTADAFSVQDLYKICLPKLFICPVPHLNSITKRHLYELALSKCQSQVIVLGVWCARYSF